MMRLSASEILKRHSQERYLRRHLRALPLDGDLGSLPRMSEAQFVASCLLVRGVPEPTLNVLGVWTCESAGSQWTDYLLEVQGKEVRVDIEQVAIRLTLREAAERCGLDWTFAEARAHHRVAIAVVTENMVARALRPEEARA